MLSLLQCSTTVYLGTIHTKVGSGLAFDPYPALFRNSTLTRQSIYFVLRSLFELLHRLDDPVRNVPVYASTMTYLRFASEPGLE